MTGGVFQAIFWDGAHEAAEAMVSQPDPPNQALARKNPTKKAGFHWNPYFFNWAVLRYERLRQGEKFTPQEGLGTLGAELGGAWEV